MAYCRNGPIGSTDGVPADTGARHPPSPPLAGAAAPAAAQPLERPFGPVRDQSAAQQAWLTVSFSLVSPTTLEEEALIDEAGARRWVLRRQDSFHLVR